MNPVMNEGALRRFRVIDLSQVRAGPNCVKQFADFGADVIKVEPPASVQPKATAYRTAITHTSTIASSDPNKRSGRKSSNV